MLKAFASKRNLNRSLTRKSFENPKSKRFWNGPRKMFRWFAAEYPVSKLSQAPVVGSHGGTPFVPGAKGVGGPNASGFSRGLCGSKPVVPWVTGFFEDDPSPPTGTRGLVMESFASQ